MGEGNEKITDYSLAELRESLNEAKIALGSPMSAHGAIKDGYAAVKKALEITEALEKREAQLNAFELEGEGLF